MQSSVVLVLVYIMPSWFQSKYVIGTFSTHWFGEVNKLLHEFHDTVVNGCMGENDS